MKPFRVVSLFSGCGGLDKGFVMANESLVDIQYQIVWANDIDETACNTYRRNFGPHIHSGDIRTISVDEVPSCDIILGGFPCQDFSVLWKRGGIDTERGSLYQPFAGLVEAKRPLVFIAENVKGLLSANRGKAIEVIAEDFSRRGYRISCELYNAADYGVPQLRERVIIVGVREDAVWKSKADDRPVVFPRIPPTTLGKHIKASKALAGVESVVDNNEPLPIRPRTKQILESIRPGGNFTDIPKDSPLYVKGMISHVYRRLHPDKPSTTIIAGGGGGTWGYHYAEPRPLTNRERARLQSFPDDFVFEGSISQVRRQIGNAVPPKLAREVALALAKFLRAAEFRAVPTKNAVGGS